jgi:hypothetical protein
MKLTKAEVIMFAAKRLTQPFSVEDLVVEAWKLDKEKFGLSGFEQQYPSNNKVYVVLMGKKGLYQDKIERVGQGMLRVK